MTDPNVQTRLNELTPAYREFVTGGVVEGAAEAFGNALGMDEDRIVIFENGIAMWFLFFLSTPQLVSYLNSECDLPPHIAGKLVDELEAGLPSEFLRIFKEGQMQLFGTAAQSVPVAAPEVTPTPTPTTLSIDNLRNQAVSMWSQYLATTDAGQQQGFRNAIASLAASAAELSPNAATPTDDLATLWQTIRDNNRAALPEIDEAARTRITETYTKPTPMGGAPSNIISAIKGTADS